MSQIKKLSTIEVLEGNELIHHFVGGKWKAVDTNHEGAGYHTLGGEFKTKAACQKACHTYSNRGEKWTPMGKHNGVNYSLHYHDSWDRLMPVVAKIESFHLYVYVETHGCWIENMGAEDKKLPWLPKFWNVEINNDTNDGRSKIDAVWITCIQFIKWYNENK